MVTTYLNFGGFYNSMHDSLITNMLESYFDDEDYSDKDINYQLIKEEYTKRYIQNFKEWLNDEISIDINLKFDGLQSPKFYNYETDKARISLTNKDFAKLLRSENDDIITFINDGAKSSDGFTSFYNGYSDVKKYKAIHVQYILSYYTDLFNDDFMLQYYDQNNGDEMLHHIDLIEGGE